MSIFAKILSELRKEKGLSLSGLAREINVSRSYLSLLENQELSPPKLPSVAVLRNMVKALVPNNPERAYQLMQAALDLYPERQLMLRGWFDEESRRQADENVREIWVISARLAENVDKRIYETTVKNIRTEHVKYVYFVPLGSQEWNYFRNQLELDVASDDLKKILCIEANPLMFFSRIAIINPGSRDTEGMVSIGSVDDSQLHDLESKVVDNIVEHLNPVIRSFKRNPENRSLRLPTGEFNLLYPQE